MRTRPVKNDLSTTSFIGLIFSSRLLDFSIHNNQPHLWLGCNDNSTAHIKNEMVVLKSSSGSDRGHMTPLQSPVFVWNFRFGGAYHDVPLFHTPWKDSGYHHTRESLKGFVCAHFSLHNSLSLSLSTLWVFKISFFHIISTLSYSV